MACLGWPLLASCLLLVLAALASPPAAGQGWVATDRTARVERAALDELRIVMARVLNVRPDPSTRQAPLGFLEAGDVVRLLDGPAPPAGNWVRVGTASGREGFVSVRWLAPLDETLARVEAAMALAAPSLVAAAAAPSRMPVDRIRAGFVYISTVGDAGWTFAHDAGRKALAKLPFVEWTRFVESVPEEPAAVAKAIDGLVEQGANLVFTTSFGFMDPTIEAAERHPQVTFMHNSGYKTAANAGTYYGREYEARYLAGLLAGGTTRSGIIGYAAAFPIPEVIRGIDAFTLGVRAVNPQAKVRVVWTDTWYSPGVEREVALRLLDGGADLLTMHQDSPAVVQAAAQRGRWAIGYHSDMSPFAPDAVLASAAWDWAPLYTKIATDLHEGRWEPYQLWWGLERGVVRLAGLKPDLSPDLVQRVREAETDIREGRLRIFAGTIVDQAGAVRVPSGRIMSDDELLAIDFFVEGVEGELPATATSAGPDN